MDRNYEVYLCKISIQWIEIMKSDLFKIPIQWIDIIKVNLIKIPVN